MQQTDLSKANARRLRQVMTPAERTLWHALWNRGLLGLKVRRQVPVGPYIADFYCAERRLIIEAGEGDHGGTGDLARDHWLSARGFHVLRLWQADILADLPAVLDRIAVAAQPD
jgi:very-short-patch-repair endonuclease